MDLTGLVESHGTQPATVVRTLERMSQEATSGVLVGLLVHQAARELIARARAALEIERAALEDLEGQRAALDLQLDEHEAAVIAARGELERLAGLEARAGAAASIALRDHRAAAAARLSEAGAALANLRGNRGAVLQQALPAARQEIARLEALEAALEAIRAPDVGDLRAALQAVLSEV